MGRINGSLDESALQRPGGRAPPRTLLSPGPPEASRAAGPSTQLPLDGHLPAGLCPTPTRHPVRRFRGRHPSPTLPAPAHRNSWCYLFWPISLIYWHIFGRRITLSSNHFTAASSNRNDRSAAPPTPLFQAAIRFKSIFFKGKKINHRPRPKTAPVSRARCWAGEAADSALSGQGEF